GTYVVLALLVVLLRARIISLASGTPRNRGQLKEVCARIGVDPRPEGWALWNTWSDGDLKVTMVVSAVETTEGLFENWARGRALDPVSPTFGQHRVHMRIAARCSAAW
ncbi:hypothetical protein ACF1FY_35375, partial [Streptomyces althioticus]|uniref:hypothetical protein n=1 Tax=Streptomyces althioticus TaxID=83380 RepID=UPI003702F674